MFSYQGLALVMELIPSFTSIETVYESFSIERLMSDNPTTDGRIHSHYATINIYRFKIQD